MSRRGMKGGIVALAALAASPARAGTPSTIDMGEHIFGATNVNAVAGHGALTVGLSSEGDVTMISWPGPTFADQLLYLSSNDLDARGEAHLGALDGMGSYLGLWLTTAKGRELLWLRDASFTHEQAYTKPDAPVVQTTFTQKALGLTVVVTDVVSPTTDVLTRSVVVTRTAASPVTDASLALYENLSPTLSRIPMVPVADWMLGWANDFVAVYDAKAKAILHLHPSDRAVLTGVFDLGEDPTQVDYGPVDALMRATPTDAQVDAFVASLDDAFAPGVAAIVTTEPPPTSFQVGSDATPFCAQANKLADNIEALPKVFHDPGLDTVTALSATARCSDSLPRVQKARKWSWAPTDALADLATGKLSGSRLAACQTNGALLAPLDFHGDTAEASVVFAFGRSVNDARQALAKETAASAPERQAAAEKAAHDALSAALLPDASLGARVVAVAERALVNLYVARDRAAGVIVASVDHQPPYYADWPRDGSFFMHALDVAGLLPWATTRGRLYAGFQRKELIGASLISGTAPTDPDTHAVGFPAHAWEMNYYADGTVGGNIRFEIDNTALHVWAVAVHAGALPASERKAFVDAVWPTTKDALELLVRWHDARTHLPAPANEDDNLTLTSTLHGATAVYAALVAGARLAEYAGDGTTARSALAESSLLQAAVLSAYYDPKTGLFVDGDSGAPSYNAGSTALGDTGWLAWPARLLDAGDPRLEKQLAADMATALADVRGETGGAAYVMKAVVPAALLGKAEGSRAMAREAVIRLADIATADTAHFGEVFVTLPGEGGGGPVFSQRVATPHVWEGALFYLSAMALSDPDRFDPQNATLPLPAVGDAGAASGGAGGGGCTAGAAPPNAPGWALLTGLIALVTVVAALRGLRRG